jgi:PBP4 family serine-type D-alanyl-D-alanine carboxypeptidase
MKRQIYFSGFLKLLALVQAFAAMFILQEAQAQVAADSSQQTTKGLTPIQELQNDINALIDSPDFAYATIGIAVQSLETGDYLYRLNDMKNFVPASTQKLLTTAAALEYLGPEFQFTTSLYIDGTISRSGEFTGNIIIRGTGDPTLSPVFDENPMEIYDLMALKLDSMGIKTIKGNIIGDDSFFDNIYYPSGWAWDDMLYPYSAQVNALSVFDNKIDIIISQGEQVGDLAVIRMKPENSYLTLINSVKTVAAELPTSVVPVKQANSNTIILDGDIALDSLKQEIVVSVAIDNPTLFFLHLFKRALEKRKISHRGALLDIDDCNEKFLYPKLILVEEHTSAPLKDILPVINRNSHNLACEMLLKAIGKETTGKGSFAKGIEQVKKFARKSGISTDNVIFVDGSGLSRLNLISPRNQINLLSSIFRSDYKDVFIKSLAVPGKNGTLKRRMLKSLAESNLWAKTGSMNNISSLCGYLRSRDGEYFAFSIMMMNFTVPDSLVQNLQDLICMRIAGFTRKSK